MTFYPRLKCRHFTIKLEVHNICNWRQISSKITLQSLKLPLQIQLYIYVVQMSWSTSDSYKACCRHSLLNTHSLVLAWCAHICAVHRGDKGSTKGVQWVKSHKVKMIMLFSRDFCAMAANINRLVLSNAKYATLWSFAVLWRGEWIWCENGLRGRVLFFFLLLISSRWQNSQKNCLQHQDSKNFPLRIKMRSI